MTGSYRNAAADQPSRLSAILEPLMFARRRLMFLLFLILSLPMAWQASGLRIDAAFDRSQPERHPFSFVDRQYRSQFGGASPLRIAMTTTAGDIYEPVFLGELKRMTDAIGHLPGIDRRQLRSLVSPELKRVVVADGNYFSASLIPATVQPARLTPPQLAQLHASVDAAGLAGRYVSADARSALIEVAFLEVDEAGGRPFSQRLLARAVQETVAAVAASGPGRYSVAVLGEPLTIAALYGELPRAALFALAGLALMLLIGSLLIGSPRIAVMVLACALLALLWQLGLMRLSGLMITPESVFALWTTMTLSVLGGMLLAARWLSESADGARAGFEASLRSWRKVAAPVTIALLSTAAAAMSLSLFSDIQLLRELSISVALGLNSAAIINGLLLPALLSGVRTSGIRRRPDAVIGRLLEPVSALSGIDAAAYVLILAAVLLGWSQWQAGMLRVEPEAGEVARLSPSSKVRSDSEAIMARFPRSADHLGVIVETARDACTRHEAMAQVDRLAWWLRNVPGVSATASLPQEAAQGLAAIADGSPKFAVLSRKREALTQAVAPISPSSGLRDRDCTALTIDVYPSRSDIGTLAAVADQVAAFNRQNAGEFYAAHPDVDAAYCADQRKARARGVVPPALAQDCPVTALPALGMQGRALARQQTLNGLRVPALLLMLAVLATVTWLLLADALAVLPIVAPVAVTGLVVPGVLALANVTLDATVLTMVLVALGAGYAINLLLHQEMTEARGSSTSMGPGWRHAVTTQGRGAVTAVLVVIAGLLPWLATDFPLQRDVGLALLATLLLNLLMSLLMVPAFAQFESLPRRPAEVLRLTPRA